MPPSEPNQTDESDPLPLISPDSADASAKASLNDSGLAAALNGTNTDAPSQAPLRRDQVSNAVAFLSNPKVVSSSVGSKRAFLQSKGLTDDEIDEAVRRTQGMAPVQPEAAPGPDPTSVPQVTPTITQGEQRTQRVHYTWTQTFVGTSVVVCAAYGIGSLALPYAVKAWNWLTNAEGGDDKTAESKLVDLLTKHIQQQEETNKDLRSVIETVKNVQANQDDHNKTGSTAHQVDAHFDSVRREVSQLTMAIRSTAAMSSEISDIKSILQQQVSTSPAEQVARQRFASMNNGLPADSHFPEHFPAGAADRAAAAAPLFAHASPSSASLFPAGAALTTSRQQDGNGDTSVLFTPGRAAGSSTRLQYGPASVNSDPAEPPHPNEFYNILEMVNNGMTPKGVRTDINDEPAAQHLEPTPSSMPRKAKPWEHDGYSKSFELAGALRAVSSQQELMSPMLGKATSSRDIDASKQQGNDDMDAPQESATY